MRAELTGIMMIALTAPGCVYRHIGSEPINSQSEVDVTVPSGSGGTTDPSFSKWLAQNIYGPDTITGQSFSGATLYYAERRSWPRSREQIVDLLKKRSVAHDKIVNAEEYEVEETDHGLVIRFTEPGRAPGLIELETPEIKEE